MSEWVSIPCIKKTIMLTMKAKYRWKEPIALYTKSKSGYVIYAPVKEVNWLFCELGCRTLIP